MSSPSSSSSLRPTRSRAWFQAPKTPRTDLGSATGAVIIETGFPHFTADAPKGRSVRHPLDALYELSRLERLPADTHYIVDWHGQVIEGPAAYRPMPSDNSIRVAVLGDTERFIPPPVQVHAVAQLISQHSNIRGVTTSNDQFKAGAQLRPLLNYIELTAEGFKHWEHRQKGADAVWASYYLRTAVEATAKSSFSRWLEPRGLKFITGIRVPVPPIIFREKWGAVPPAGLLDRTDDYRQIALHHFQSGHYDPDALRWMKSIQDLHIYGNRWSEIGYNCAIGAEGEMLEGRGEPGRLWENRALLQDANRHGYKGAHAGGNDDRWERRDNNDFALGIGLMGNFDHELPSADQLRSLLWAIAFYAEANSINLEEEWSLVAPVHAVDKTCPGKYVTAMLPTLREMAFDLQHQPTPEAFIRKLHDPDFLMRYYDAVVSRPEMLISSRQDRAADQGVRYNPVALAEIGASPGLDLAS